MNVFVITYKSLNLLHTEQTILFSKGYEKL